LNIAHAIIVLKLDQITIIRMAAAPKEIPLTELTIPQLNQLNQQLEQELELLQNSLSSLKVAQQKFTECRESLGALSPLHTDILVPLTSSMYVPGRLSDIETCLVDVGTGYYMEKKVAAGREYYQRKVDFLAQQMEKVQPVLQDKYHMKEALMEVMQQKVQSQVQAQQQLAASLKS